MLLSSLAPASRRLYCTAWRSYARFALLVGLPPRLPIPARALELYVASAACRLRPDTLRTYLSGLAFLHSLAGFSTLRFRSARLRLLIRGARRSGAPPAARPPRIPLAPHHLLSALVFFRRHFSPYDASLFHTAFALAFFGLLRASEFVSPSVRSFRPARDLCLRDVAFDRVLGVAYVRIKVSKNDPFGRGHVVRLCRTGTLLCPYAALVAFFSVRVRLGPGPFFQFVDGRFLTRGLLVAVLRAVFPAVPPAMLSSHCFRIGGASRLCHLGVPDATIQVLGRWSSDAFRRYLRLSDALILALQSRMGSR